MSGTLRLRGATSGYSELQAPAVAADQTFVLPTAGGTLLTTDSPVAKLTLELGSNSQPSLTFEGDTDTGLYSSGTNTLNLVTGGSNRLVIDSSGNVGVGTSSPSSLLHLAGSANSAQFDSSTGVYLTFKHNGTAVGYIGSANQAYTGGATGDIAIAGGSGSSLTFATANTERMRIDSSGNVGIGTTTVNSNLHVYDGSGDAEIRITSNSSNQAILRFGNTVDQTLGSIRLDSPTDSLQFYGFNDSERMRIDSSGRVGIGEIAPLGKLHVKTADSGIASVGASADDLVIESDTNVGITLVSNSENVINFADSSDVNVGQIAYNHSSNYMSFRANDSERMRINSSGSLQIGGTADTGSQRLQVQGGSSSTADVIICNSVASSGQQAQITLAPANNVTGARIIATAEEDFSVSANRTARLEFHTRQDGSLEERMRIASNGDVLIAATNAADNVDTGFKFRAVNNSIACTIDTSASTASHYHLYNLNATNNGYRFYVKANGGVNNYSANNQNLSDINVKKDISPVADTWDCIKEWEIVNYRYKDQPNDTDLNLGVIAQQVAESCPEVVTIFQEAKEATDDQPAQEERLGVKEQQMMWMAIKALQEAQDRIETLEANNLSLENRIAALENN